MLNKTEVELKSLVANLDLVGDVDLMCDTGFGFVGETLAVEMNLSGETALEYDVWLGFVGEVARIEAVILSGDTARIVDVSFTGEPLLTGDGDRVGSLGGLLEVEGSSLL